MTQSAQDLALMERLAAGDNQALKALFMRYRLQVYRFIGRIVRNDAVAEEQTNEVFLDVWRSAASFQGQSSPYTGGGARKASMKVKTMSGPTRVSTPRASP